MCWLSRDEIDFPTPFFLCSEINLIIHSVMQLVTACSLMQFLVQHPQCKGQKGGHEVWRKSSDKIGLDELHRLFWP